MQTNILSMGIETFFSKIALSSVAACTLPRFRRSARFHQKAALPGSRLCVNFSCGGIFCGVCGQRYGAAVFVQCGAPEYCGEKGGPARQRRGKGGEGQRAAGPEFKKAGGILLPACTAHEKGAAGPVWTMGKPFVCGKPDKKGKALSLLPSRNALPYTES